MEEHEVPHEGIDARIGEIVAGRGDEQDFVPLFVEGRINADTRDRLDIVAQEFDDFLHCMGLDAEMVAGAVAVGHRVHDPVGGKAQFQQHLAHQNRQFGGVDAVGAVQGAAAALGTLVEVAVPLLDDAGVQPAGSGHLAEQPARQGEVLAVHRTQKFGAQYGHVLGIIGAEEEMTLVRARAAAHAYIHEHLEGTVLVKPFLQGVVHDVFPVGGKVPVLILRRPGMGALEAEAEQGIRLGRITVVPGTDLRFDVHPSLGGKSRRGGQQFSGCGHFGHGRTP